MGILKKIGLGLGDIARETGEKAARVAHHATKSEWVRDVLSGAGRATERNAQQLGEVADGALDAAIGAVTQDRDRRYRGVEQIGATTKQAASEIAQGAVTTAGHAMRAAQGVVTGDIEQATAALKEVGKVAAIGVLSIGVADGIVDVVDLVEEGSFAKPVRAPNARDEGEPLDTGESCVDDEHLEES